MKNRLLSLSFVLFTLSGVFSSSEVSAQDKEIVRNAEAAFVSSDWMTAEKNYKQLVSSNPENPLFHSQLGYCYLQEGKKDLALTEIRKAKDLYSKGKEKLPALTNEYYLGSALRQADSVDKALTVLNALKPKVKNAALTSKIDNEIKSCNLAKEMNANPNGNVIVLNLGKFVNGATDDHTPSVAPDGQMLFYTSREKVDGHAVTEDGGYDENVYFSTIEPSTGTWSKPKFLSETVNTQANVSVECLSNDGTELYLYNDDKNGTIMVSKKQGNSWGEPEALNGNINTDYRESGASISKDGNKLYFASNRPGGLGGLDLYVSERIGGDWGPAVNLGSVVNTAMDEEGPFIDGGTLYFSSTGHNGLGGYDIFKTTLNGATWSTPENLGKPINSTSDDVFWSTAKDGKSYFASDRANGSGASDLYVCGSSSLLANVEARLQGTVTHCAKPLPASTISIRDNSTGIESEITPNSDGSFEIVAYRGHNYSLSATCAGNVVFDDMFDVSVNAPSSSEYKTIKLDPGVECPVEDAEDKPVTLVDNGNEYVVEIRDLNFAFAKADAIVSNSDLDKLAEYLKNNKKAKVQLGGYCDATGPAKSNATLGKRRADAVKTYLTKQGVKSSQLDIVGFGEENPISLNKVGGNFDENAKQYNRRVEVEVLNQGEGKQLVIRPLNNIPQRYKNPDYKVNGYVKAKGYPEIEK